MPYRTPSFLRGQRDGHLGSARARLALLALSLGLALPGAAGAFRPTAQPADLVIPLPGSEVARSWPTLSTRAGTADVALQAFQARHGGEWSVERDPLTGIARQLYGSGIALSAAALATDEGAEEAGLTFLRGETELFRMQGLDVRPVIVERAAGKVAAHYRQYHHGILVDGTHAKAIFNDSGRLFAMGARVYPEIDVSVAPSLDEAQAAAIAKAAIGFVEGRDALTGSELRILPATTDGAYVYHLAWRVVLDVKDPFGIWVTWVDAHTSAILARENEIHTLNVTGSVEGDADHPAYCLPDSRQPFHSARIEVVGGSTAQADSLGDFDVPHGGVDPVTIEADLYGPWVDVNWIAGTDALASLAATPGVPATVVFDSTNSRGDERDCWYHTNRTHDHIKSIDPTWTPGMNYRMTCWVDRTDGFCPGNAWYSGSINFCRESAAYGNTGRISDVIYHEWGHGLNSRVYAGFGFDTSISEGNADINSLYVGRAPLIGAGFYLNQCGHGIRTCNNTYVYPDNWSDSHDGGMIIAGVFYDMTLPLVTRYGEDEGWRKGAEIWHFGRRVDKPADQPEQVVSAFIGDDDDGNLDNGTPNYDAIAFAASVHGFASWVPVISEGVDVAHAPLASTTDESSARAIVATAASSYAGISSVTLHYRVDGGGLVDVAMAPTGNPGEYAADIPAFPQPSEVEYYVEAEDASANTGFAPRWAPGALYAYDVVFLYDPCESTGAWTLGAVDDDAVNGTWKNNDPVYQIAEPEDDMTPDPGARCFITRQGNVGGGKTTLFSPVWDVSTLQDPVVKYWRWYSNEGGGDGAGAVRFDPWLTQVTNDSGATWQDVESTKIGGDAWKPIEVRLTDFFPSPSQIQFRFVAVDTGLPTTVEAGVDDVRILGAVTVTAVPGERLAGAPRLAFALGQNEPNPFNPATSLRYTLPLGMHVRLEIINTWGQRVRTLQDGAATPGVHVVRWDGRDDADRAVASGVYFARLSGEGFTRTMKMTLVR